MSILVLAETLSLISECPDTFKLRNDDPESLKSKFDPSEVLALASALTASAVTNPFNRFADWTAEVVSLLVEDAVIEPCAVSVIVPDTSSGATFTPTTELVRTTPSLPRQGTDSGAVGLEWIMLATLILVPNAVPSTTAGPPATLNPLLAWATMI